MATYEGHRPILPVQNSNEWVHHYTGEPGVYSNWSLMSGSQLLEDMPLRDHLPGDGYHPHDIQMSRWFRGLQRDAPMELAKYSHGGQSAPYLRHARWEFHGVDSAEIFGDDWGHDGTRVISTSRWSNWIYRGLDATRQMVDPGFAPRAWNTAIAWHGPINQWEYQGVGDDILEDGGRTLEEQYEVAYGFGRIKEWFGVESSKAL